jgi:chromosome segregation protein
MSHEDLEGIENEITTLSTENETLKNKIEDLNKIIKNNELKFKMEADKTEGLNEKIKILQNSLNSYSNKSNETEMTIQKLNQTNNELKNDYSNLMNKYHTLLDEMEIYNKNVKKNFSLEVNIKELTEENEKLAEMIKTLQNSEDFKIKFLLAQSELKEVNEKYNLLNNSYNDIKLEHEKLSNENFEKFGAINKMQNEIKIKNHKIEELDKENKNLKKQIEELENKLKESDYSVKAKKNFYDTQIKELKKEIDKLIKTNETLKKEHSDAIEELKKYQHYTNFAKASKESLTKKDFSILENMSRRVEELNVILNII